MEIKEAKELLGKYSKEDIVFGKKKDYILDRISATEEEVVNDLLKAEALDFVEKQERSDEIRYTLFFVYSRKSGRVYVTKLEEKLRIITAYPLGKKTLSKYHKRRFIRNK